MSSQPSTAGTLTSMRVRLRPSLCSNGPIRRQPAGIPSEVSDAAAVKQKVVSGNVQCSGDKTLLYASARH
jgi:hypothetical protein